MKSVRVIGPGVTYGALQAMYFDRANNSLYPDVCIVGQSGEILFETNALGLRGPDVLPGQRIGVVWGDSVAFCVPTRGWPEMINDLSSDLLFLNGGLEGVEYSAVLQRAVTFNRTHAVAVNVVLPGLHPVGRNETFQDDLLGALTQIANPILATLPTSLNESMLDRDISSLFVPLGDETDWRALNTFYGFFGAQAYSVDFQVQLFEHICARNEIIRGVSRATGAPLIDLFAAFKTTGLDITGDFFDVSHPRPKTYAKMAALVYEGITAAMKR
jgi:hypothetical protein